MLVDVVRGGVLARAFLARYDDRERIYAVVLYHAAKVACVGSVIMVELFAQRVVSVEHGHAAFAQRGQRRLLRHGNYGVIFLVRRETLRAQPHRHSLYIFLGEAFAVPQRRLRCRRDEFGERGAHILERRKYDAAVLVENDALSDGAQRLHVEAVLRPKHGVAAAELHRLVEGRLYARLAGGDEHGAQPRLARDDGCDVVADDHRAALYLQPVQQRPDLRSLVNGTDLYAVVQQAAQDGGGARNAREAYDGEFFLVVFGELDGLEDVARRNRYVERHQADGTAQKLRRPAARHYDVEVP